MTLPGPGCRGPPLVYFPPPRCDELRLRLERRLLAVNLLGDPALAGSRPVGGVLSLLLVVTAVESRHVDVETSRCTFAPYPPTLHQHQQMSWLDIP